MYGKSTFSCKSLGTTLISSVLTFTTASASSGGRVTGAMDDQVIERPHPALLSEVVGTFLADLCPVFSMEKISSSFPVLRLKVKVAMTPLFAASLIPNPLFPQVVSPSQPSTI